VAAPERAEDGPNVESEADAPPGAIRSGRGGKRSERGDGAIAGGGGGGAPLFSAPQPQSAGDTPRGAREVEPRSAGAGGEPAGASGAGDGGGPAALERGGESTAGEPSGRQVEGVLLAGERRAAAPGLFGAGSGGRQDPLAALLLVGAIGGAAAVGFGRGRLEAA